MLCTLVTAFHIAFKSSDSLTLVKYFIGVAAPLVVVPAIESCRPGRSKFIAYPNLFAMASQVVTGAQIIPLYWLCFILTGGAGSGRLNSKNTHISQAAAEAVVFGIIIGAVIPSVAMLVFDDPYVTAIWQFYPLLVSIAQQMHLLFRPVSRYPQSGHQTILGLYIATFIFCSSIHIATVWPMVSDIDTMKRVFVPLMTLPTTMDNCVFHLFKWDLGIAFGSSILATFWLANSWSQLIFLVAWSGFATPIFGPGAATMGPFLWREISLQNHIEANVKEGVAAASKSLDS
jgi:hypothetical protein